MVARRTICTRSYVDIAQSGCECTIFRCVTTIRLCHLQGILPKLALLAYIDTLAIQAKNIDNKSVVHVKTTIDRRPLAVTNQKGWNATLSLNFSATKRAVEILDAKYDKADLPAVVKENCSHLTSADQMQLLQLLQKFEQLFDGTLGD